MCLRTHARVPWTGSMVYPWHLEAQQLPASLAAAQQFCQIPAYIIYRVWNLQQKHPPHHHRRSRLRHHHTIIIIIAIIIPLRVFNVHSNSNSNINTQKKTTNNLSYKNMYTYRIVYRIYGIL